MQTLIPQTMVSDARATFDFVEKVFDAEITEIYEENDRFSHSEVDSQGNQWWISTHIEDVSEEEMQRRIAELRS
jgi:uncharacterized glyoxalase superfamily protein PhnB